MKTYWVPRRKYLLLSFVLAFLLGFSTASAGVLDGKRFVGLTGEKGKNPDHEDTLVFQDGMFASIKCEEKMGFRRGSYATSMEENEIYFEAETVSPKYGKMVWKGTVKGEMLEATFIWTKEKWYWKIRREYWFKGYLEK